MQSVMMDERVVQVAALGTIASPQGANAVALLEQSNCRAFDFDTGSGKEQSPRLENGFLVC
jgi:hypothetical protein